MSGSHLLPDDFLGQVRLFPLPDLVLFPHVVQPLRIFEPRYVALLEDATRGDQLITMALLQPGWEADYEGQPRIHHTVCVGRVISQSQQTDGCYNLLLAGIARGRIQRELETSRPYRQAEIELLPDQEVDPSDGASSSWRERLLQVFYELNPEGVNAEPTVKQLLKDQVPLGMLTDVIAYAAPLRLTDKQTLLGEPSVVRRVELLIGWLEELICPTSRRDTSSFPPDFSDN